MNNKWYHIPNSNILIPDIVEVKIGGPNIKYYQEKGYKLPYKINKWGKETIPWGSTLKVKARDLPKKCSEKFPCKCKICGNTKDKFLNPWYSSLSKINNNRGCPKCNGKQTHLSKEIFDIAEKCNIKITSEEKKYYKLNDKIELQCLKCGNNQNKHNKNWRVAIGNFLHRKNLCPMCYNFTTMTKSEVVELLKEKKMIPLNALPENIIATYQINVECEICGNTRDRYNKNQWAVDLNHLKSQNVGCPKCKKMQTISDEEFISFLHKKNITLIKRGVGSLGKNKLQCDICESVFHQTYDGLRAKKRGCLCEKYTWFAFEELIGNYFGGQKNIKINNTIPDRLFEKEKIILEIKFGKISMNERSYRQSKKYFETGFKIVYVINAHKDEIKEEFLLEGIEYYFLENFKDLKIRNKILPDAKIAIAEDMYRNPHKYSKKSQPGYYQSIKDIFLQFCESHKRLPSSSELKLLEIDYSTIKRAYGLPPNCKLIQLSKATGYKIKGNRSGIEHKQSINIVVLNLKGEIITKNSMQGICRFFNKPITWVSSNMLKGNKIYFLYNQYLIVKEKYHNDHSDVYKILNFQENNHD